MASTLTIPARFNGPADSANGGYTCGLLAREIDGPAEVSLRAPPPLERELSIERDGERVVLRDGETVVAEAAPIAEPAWEIPPPVPLEDARGAEPGSPFLRKPRPFETCFVCGPDRGHLDPGLRIFPGPVDAGGALQAGVWTADPAFAGDDGNVLSEVVWASLDCPTSGPVANWHTEGDELRPIVLARLAADVRAPMRAGDPHVVTAWPIEVDGRKRHAGAALFTADGELVASSRALWIELKPTA